MPYRYLIETADYAELEDVMEVAQEAFHQLPEEDRERGVDNLISILGTVGLLWGHRGYFARAIPHVRRCNQLQSERENKSLDSLCWTQANLGNVLASAGEYDEALKWELKAEKTRRLVEGADNIRPSSIVQENIGRCYTFLNQFDDASERLQSAAKDFEGSQNWAMLAL